MLRYAITDRRAFSGDENAQNAALMACMARWVEVGIDFVQLREKDLSEAELYHLAKQVRVVVPRGGRTRLLINESQAGPVTLASGADGVHMPLLHMSRIRAVLEPHWNRLPDPVVSVSCHTLADVREVRNRAPDLILFGPVFEKRVRGEVVRAGVGLKALSRAAALAPGRVLALGGVTAENAERCLDAGAVGVAGIRTFAEI